MCFKSLLMTFCNMFSKFQFVFLLFPPFSLQELVQSLKGYLKARGVDQEFAASILPFYRNFEHSAYVENFLSALHKFLNK